MQIRKIVLYSHSGETREIGFGLGKVNIITGESKSGKSTLTEIIEYCLGSSTCDISEGVIRETVQYFALLVKFEDDEYSFIARQNPNIKGVQAVSTVFLNRSSDVVPKFDEINSNLNIDSLKVFLSRKIGISENINVPDSLTREPLIANFKHSRFYCYQPQYLIADPHQLFYNQNKEFVPQAIKDTLPYILGAINENSLIIDGEISQLKKQLGRLLRERKEDEKIKDNGLEKATSLIKEAQEIGLLEKRSEESNDLIYERLRTISDWDYRPLAQQEENSQIKDLIKLRQERKNELSKINDNKRGAVEYLKNSSSYSNEVRQQLVRLDSIGLYHHPTASNFGQCPFCANDLHETIPSIQNINDTIEKINSDLQQTNTESPRIQSFIESLDSQSDEVLQEIRSIEQSITALYTESEKARNLRDLNIRRGKVIGRVSLFLESVANLGQANNVYSKITDLENRIHALEAQIDSEDEKERLLSIINKINLQMSRWSDKLDIEVDYLNAPIRFDLGKLTLFIDANLKPIPLNQIGSGANWVSYHLLILFALHKHFIQNRRPTPRFLVLDQPTQVYYPPEKATGVVEITSDEVAVNKMFDFIFDTVEDLNGKLQVIITDHAYLQATRFRNSVVEIWRDGRKLIPDHWERRK